MYVKFQVFTANSDRDTVVEHAFSPVIIARYLRVLPTEWNERPALRMELYGCYNGE